METGSSGSRRSLKPAVTFVLGILVGIVLGVVSALVVIVLLHSGAGKDLPGESDVSIVPDAGGNIDDTQIEAAAAERLMDISTQQEFFRNRNGSYTTDMSNGRDGLNIIGAGSQPTDTIEGSGYRFRITQATEQRWCATATPLSNNDKLKHFYIDQSRILRYKNGAPADSNSPQDGGKKR